MLFGVPPLGGLRALADELNVLSLDFDAALAAFLARDFTLATWGRTCTIMLALMEGEREQYSRTV
jgi:hypothetical protein